MPTNNKPHDPPSFAIIQSAVREYCRGYIRRLRELGRSYQDIADELGVSHVWVMGLEKGKNVGTGGRVEYQIACTVHGGSVDGLRQAAMNVYAGGRVIVERHGVPVEIQTEPPLKRVNGNPRKSRGR
jgi:hypothetical protein